jgi:DNA-binding PadR family transcriptional regulator
MSLSAIDISNLTKNLNEILILATLYKEKKHGYQIALEIEEKSDGLFKFNHGTLYPILHKLEKEGLIKGTWTGEESKRQRKYYTITAKGKKYATGQVVSWNEFFTQLFDIVGEIKI